jgi:hypothetical protein
LGSFADLEGFLHHVDDTPHSLNDVIGLGRVFDFLLELGATSGVAGAFTEAVGEVATASVVEVAVKEPNQISTGEEYLGPLSGFW